MKDTTMLDHIPDDMMPIVNITTGSIVLLPQSCWYTSTNPKPNHLVSLTHIRMMGIEDDQYQILAEKYKILPYTDSDLSFDFFYMRCIEAINDDKKARLDKQAYQYIYDQLRQANYSIQYILEGVLQKISSYREIELLDGLEWLGIKHQYMVEDESRRALVRGMREKQGWRYRTHYFVDGVETVLFENLEDHY